MPITDFTTDTQHLFLEMMLQNPDMYARVQNIYKTELFDKSLRKPAEFIRDHCEKYTTMPTQEQMTAVTGMRFNPQPNAKEGNYDWFLESFEGFIKQKALNNAILTAATFLEEGNYDPVEKLIKDAVQISLTKDMGTDYFENPLERMQTMLDTRGQISTGWKDMDEMLFGGMNKGELQIFAGGSGSGKSLVMQNMSVNWMEQGMHGVYLTLELDEGMCAHRLDSMVTGVSSRDVFRQMDEVAINLKEKSEKYGSLHLKYMPSQSNINDIRAYIRELEIKTERKIDFLMVDYLDLLMPVSVKVDPSNLFVKDKYVSEELRNLAKELNVLFVTASQLNRESVEAEVIDHNHISGGISKINTADNVFAIATNATIREKGEYRIQALKTRSSSGVGKTITLDYDIASLRISHCENPPDYTSKKHRASLIADNNKTGDLDDGVMDVISPDNFPNPRHKALPDSDTSEDDEGVVAQRRMTDMLAIMKAPSVETPPPPPPPPSNEPPIETPKTSISIDLNRINGIQTLDDEE